MRWPQCFGIVLILVIVPLISRAGSAATGVPDRPNIVILYADDLGFGDLGVQNPDSKIPTPNLDRLASEGLRLTDAHSSSGICTPSRYALLTGRYHWRKFHNIVTSFGPSVFDSERLTLPEMLRACGYETACIGKWHLGWDWEASLRVGAGPTRVGRRDVYAPEAFDWTRPILDGPLAHGFDTYFGDDVPNFPPYTWIRDDRVETVPTVPLVETPPTAEGRWEARPGPMAEGWRLDAVMPRLTDEAVAWIAQREGSDRPFFLYFPWTSPHAPIVPTEEYVGTSEANGYGDFVVQSDATAGRILKALEAHGFDDETLVIFTSDNGPEGYAYERVRRFEHRSMGPLRGLKRDIWEGGHRVPMLVRWPGVVEPGRVSDVLIGQIDIMATIASIIGYDLDENDADDSFGFLSLLIDSEAPTIRTSLVHNTRADHYAVRRGDWVLIDAPTGAITKVPPWFDEANGYRDDPRPAALYNLRDDLAQRQNRVDDHPELVEELRGLLDRIRAKGQRLDRSE